jgi:hypothetical protein
MPSPTYALTRPSSQSRGAVRSWKASSAGMNGSIASSGPVPSSSSRVRISEKWLYSATAIAANAALSAMEGAKDASSASRSNAVSSP